VELGDCRPLGARDLVPQMASVAILWNPANPDQKSSFNEIQAGARALGVTFQSVEARSREELEQALAMMKRSRPSALLMTADGVHQRYIGRIVAFTSETRLPAMYQLKEAVDRGGLMSYGASLPDLSRRTATYVDISKHAGRVNRESIVVDAVAA